MKIKILIIALFSGLIIITAGCNKPDPSEEFPMSLEVEPFDAMNQDGEKVTLDSLKGKVWIADLIFTNCTSVCSPMTANMARLQKMVNEQDLDVTFVSFTIDPKHDTANVLKNYGELLGADFENWHFLTGYTQSEIEKFANVSFLSPATKLEGTDQFIHGSSFYLVNAQGIVLQKYEGVTNTPYDQIVSDLKLFQ